MKEDKNLPLKYPQKSHKEPRKDLTGRTFELLTVVGYDKDGKWFCKCNDCGAVRSVRSNNLHSGNTLGCGVCGNRKSAMERMVDGTIPESITSNVNKNNKSGIKGVSFNNRKKKWVAQINFKGKHYHLGYHDTLEYAVKARKKAENDLYTEYLEKLKTVDFDKWLKITERLKNK